MPSFPTLRHRGRRSRRRTIPELLQRQIDHAIRGVAHARDVCTEAVDGDGRRQMAEIEHHGDSARARLIDQMSRSLTTPLDREDIFRASRSIDDVLDNVRDLVREIHLWRVTVPPQALAALDAVAEALTHLRASARTVHDAASREHVLAARKSAKAVRACYQHGLADVFAQEFTMEVLKQREVLRRLDVVALRLIEATDALLDGQVKRTM